MLEVKIEKLKGIDKIELSLPFEKGVFAVCGGNGVGKSTLFTVLSKLVYKGALTSYFRNEGNNQTKITFKLEGKTNIWTKSLNWTRDDEGDEIKLNGFFEGSLIYGNRFSDADKKLLRNVREIKKKPNLLKDAEEFIVKNLGSILRDDTDYYKGLKVIKTKKIAESFGFKSIPYFWNSRGDLISQMSMSSGEYLLISLLHFINQRLEYTKKNNIDHLSLIILDEMELALHPSAQNRLAKFLKELSNNHNFCIYFATHSVQIISQLPPSSIFFLETLYNETIQVVNPCYPAYATRSMYTPDGFDFIFLVEDTLAKKIIENCLKGRGVNTSSMLFKVLPCGGWEKTLELQREFQLSNIAGHSSSIISILDGDIKADYERKYLENKDYKVLRKVFLPIFSVEKYLKKHLIDDFDNGLYTNIAAEFYQVRSLNDILKDYSKNFGIDNNGKKLFSLLQSCSMDTGRDNSEFTDRMIDLIVRYGDFERFSSSIDNIINPSH